MIRNYLAQTKQANIKRFTGKFSCWSHNFKQVKVDVILHDEGIQSNLASAVLSESSEAKTRRDIKPVRTILVQMGISETVINFFLLIMRKVFGISVIIKSFSACFFSLCFRCNHCCVSKYNISPPADLYNILTTFSPSFVIAYSNYFCGVNKKSCFMFCLGAKDWIFFLLQPSTAQATEE